MDLSLFYFANDSTEAGARGRYELLIEGAKFADQNGFAAVWTPERHFHAFGGSYPNPSVLGAAIAAVTERVAIRAGSVVAPLHDPLRIAEEWSVVDNLSGGRAGVAFASGWHAVDFCLRPQNHDDRRQVTIDAVREVRELWHGEPRAVKDGLGRPVEVRAYPPPVQRELPIWLTAARGIDTFRAAGELRAGVLTHMLGQDLGELTEKIAEYRRVAAEKHDGWPGHVVLMLHTLIGEDTEQVRELVRGPFSEYLKSSMHLIARSLVGDSMDLDNLNEADMDFLTARAFDRYFERGGLFGTVDKVAESIKFLEQAGVDEVGCLIDFGVATKDVLHNLRHLGELNARVATNL